MRAAVLTLLLAGAAAAGVAVRRDGRVIRDPAMEVSKDTLSWGEKRRKTEPLRAYLLVEKDDGTLVWAPHLRARIRGYVALARASQCESLAKLVKDAVRARDHVLARRLYERCMDLGLGYKDSESLRKRVEKLEAKPRKAKPDKVEAVRAAERAIDAQVADLLARRAATAIPKDRVAGLRILREALRRAPAHEGANKLLAAQAPASFALGDARAWLDFHLEVERHGFKFGTGEELELKRARHHWRPDLYGVGSDEVFLITAMRDFELVGRCLGHGHLVCRMLSSLFKTDQPVQRERGPLTLFLYMDKKAYKDHSGDYRPIYDPRYLDWSTGHWSARDDISRFHWPRDADEERRFLYVFRHTIAVHWMHARNPLYSVGQASRSWKSPAYWLDIGFIELVAQGHFDVERGTWDLWNPRCRNLDSLQALVRQQRAKLHDWGNVFLWSNRQTSGLPGKNAIRIVRRWSLWSWLLSPYHVWRDQAASAFRCLWFAEQGKHRPRLLQAIAAQYRGERERLDPKTVSGLTSAELGRKTEEFAKKVAHGWAPSDKG